MSHPWGLVVDNAGRLYVADTANNRVLRFDNAQTLGNGAQASAVFGQVGFTQFASGDSASGLSAPTALAVMNLNGGSTTLWVAATGNYRILRYDKCPCRRHRGVCRGTSRTGGIRQQHCAPRSH